MSLMIQPMTGVALQQAAWIIRGGGIIAFPTETFYALGATPFDASAVGRIFELKGRSPTSSPILVLIRHRADLESLVSDITTSAELLMNACWPGPLTLVFRASSKIPLLLTAGTATIGVRFSASVLMQQVLTAVEGPLTGTSANRSGAPSATTAQEVEAAFGPRLDLILDGGPTAGGLPSTVVDTTVAPPRLIREGVLPKTRLLSVIGALAA